MVRFYSIFLDLSLNMKEPSHVSVMAGLEAANRRGRKGGRPRAINEEKMEAILEDLKAGTSKASICRNFGIKRSTLYDALVRELKIEDLGILPVL